MRGRSEIEIRKTEFYLDIKRNPEYGIFLTVYDKEVLEGDTFLKGKEYTKISKGEELIRELRDAVSIIFYGEKAVELGVILKYVHPEAVGVQKGIKTAIYIMTF